MNTSISQQKFPDISKLPKIHAASHVVMSRVGIHESLAYSVAIATVSQSIQGHCEVNLSPGFNSPNNIWMLIIVPSGGGKTPTIKMFQAGIACFDKKQYFRYQNDKNEYEDAIQDWEIENKENHRMLRSAIKKGNLEKKEELKKLIKAHNATKPKAPRLLKTTILDATPEEIFHSMAVHSPNVAIVNDEGKSFFYGPQARQFPKLNQAWEGTSITIERRGLSEPLRIEKPCLSMTIGIQPEIMNNVFMEKGQETRDLGSFARFLMIKPPDQIGYRDVRKTEMDITELTKFQDHCEKMLDKTIDKNGELITKKMEVTFSPEARQLFQRYEQHIEESIRESGIYREVRDAAAKATRNAARMAAAFEVFEFERYVIQFETMEIAIHLMEWYMNEYRRIMTTPPKPTQEVADADILLPWLQQFSSRRNNRVILLNDIQKHAPNQLRNKDRLHKALEQLTSKNKIFIGQIERITFIDMMNNYPGLNPSLHEAIMAHRSRRNQKCIYPTIGNTVWPLPWTGG